MYRATEGKFERAIEGKRERESAEEFERGRGRS